MLIVSTRTLGRCSLKQSSASTATTIFVGVERGPNDTRPNASFILNLDTQKFKSLPSLNPPKVHQRSSKNISRSKLLKFMKIIKSSPEGHVFT